MKKAFAVGLIAIMVMGVFVLSSCFSPAAPTLGTAISDAISSWSTDVAVNNVTGVVIGYPGRKIGGNYVGGFSKKLYIEDDKGGVYVYNYNLNETYDSTPSAYKFNLGDVVTVSGTLTKYYDDYEIVAATSDVVKTGKTVEVVPDDLTAASTLTGHLERLVKISGTATEVSGKSFKVITDKLGTITVYDGTYGGGLDFDTLIENGDNVEVTGIYIIYSGAPEILPRVQKDIVKK